MQLDYFFFYTEANIVCIVVLAILMINDRLHNTRQEKQIWFNRTVIAHILYFTSDIGWAAVLSGQLPRIRFLVAFFNLVNYILLSLLAFEWFLYMAASEKMEFRKNRRKRIAWHAPMVVSVLVIMIAYAAAPDFWINEKGELNQLYYPLFILAPLVYLTASFIFSMKNAKRSESREEKRLYRLIGIYPLTVLGFGLVQTFSLDAPLFCFGCTTMMLFFYIQNMQALVSVDSLTRLNNRGQINRYMDQTQYKENVRVYIMMMDVDRFKEINDTYGHAEGDRALVLVAESLKKVVERIKAPVFLGRYGGDEFTIFIQQQQEGEDLPEIIAAAVRNALAERQRENRLPYELEVSIGWAMLEGKDDTMDACLNRADKKLYEDKRRKA